MGLTIIGKKFKQPGETIDFYVDYSDWFAGSPPEIPARNDAPLSYAVTVPAGITKEYDSIDGSVIKIVLSGGTSGRQYKITVRLTTDASPPIVKEADFAVAVQEV